MNDNYYSELDLRYPEIAYNQEAIFRPNPGTVNFSIPALTGVGGTHKDKSIQKNTNIKNQDKPSIGNIQFNGIIPIKVPKELCCYMNYGYSFDKFNMSFSEESSKGNITATGNSTYIDTHTYDLNIQSSGGDTHTHSGTVIIGGGISEQRDFDINFEKTSEGSIGYGKGHMILSCDDPYIPKGSAWIVVFIGGDINKPAIISRYYG